MANEENGWQPIESAPRDGTIVFLRRIYEGRIITEGESVWGVMAEDAPMRLNDENGPADIEFADTPRWLKPDRRHVFPTPTHYCPCHPHQPYKGE